MITTRDIGTPEIIAELRRRIANEKDPARREELDYLEKTWLVDELLDSMGSCKAKDLMRKEVLALLAVMRPVRDRVAGRTKPQGIRRAAPKGNLKALIDELSGAFDAALPRDLTLDEARRVLAVFRAARDRCARIEAALPSGRPSLRLVPR
jgi:hypothetical protein